MAGFVANTTCDVYREGNAPPAAPDVAGVACSLRPGFPLGNEQGDASSGLFFSHIMDVDVDTDVRDGAEIGPNASDWVYVPDQNGTQFRVIAVVRSGYGSGADRRRVFLKRMAAWFPTVYL